MKTRHCLSFGGAMLLALACEDSTVGPDPRSRRSPRQQEEPLALGTHTGARMEGAHVALATRSTPVSGAFILDAFAFPPEGSIRLTPNWPESGNVHLDQFFELYWIVTGDVEGTAVSRQSGNLNAKGGGVIHSRMDVSVTGYAGGFAGYFAGSVKASHLFAHMVLHGTGELEGKTLQIDFEGPLGLGNAFNYRGRIVSSNR